MGYTYYPQSKKREKFAGAVISLPGSTEEDLYVAVPAKKVMQLTADKVMVADVIQEADGGPHQKTKPDDMGVVCGLFGDGHALPCNSNPDVYNPFYWEPLTLMNTDSYNFRKIMYDLR